MRYDIEFSGHENIRSNHQKTIEITKESHLSVRGDCIVGVDAALSCADLPVEIKEKLCSFDAKVTIIIAVEDREFIIKGSGHPDLTLNHTHDIVLRKSEFICPRTLAIKCDKASDLLPREMVTLLQNPESRGKFSIIVD